MSDRIRALIDPMQPSGRNSLVDRADTEAKRKELLERYNPVLAGRKTSHSVVRTWRREPTGRFPPVWAYFRPTGRGLGVALGHRVHCWHGPMRVWCAECVDLVQALSLKALRGQGLNARGPALPGLSQKPLAC